jgi:two-component system, LytTR family, response regulator
MYKAVLIDDEIKSRNLLKSILENYCSDIFVAGEAKDVKSGTELIRKEKPDIVFLDIEMPDGTGFDLLERVSEHQFFLIFATGHNDFAIKAFKYNAIDYIPKPADIEDVKDAVERIKKTQNLQINEKLVKQLLFSVNEKQKRKLVLKNSDEIHIVDIGDIIRCEAEGGYTTFFLKGGKKIIISKNLKEYEEILKYESFIRTHNSHLVNLCFVEKYRKADGGFLIMNDKSQVPVSIRKKESVLDALENIF